MIAAVRNQLVVVRNQLVVVKVRVHFVLAVVRLAQMIVSERAMRGLKSPDLQASAWLPPLVRLLLPQDWSAFLPSIRRAVFQAHFWQAVPFAEKGTCSSKTWSRSY